MIDDTLKAAIDAYYEQYGAKTKVGGFDVDADST